MESEEAKLALQTGYFILLGYVIRRGFNILDKLADGLLSRLDAIVKAIKESK